VTSTERLREQLRLVIHEGFRFLVVGGIGTVLTIAGAVALHGLGKYVAITIATIVATIFSFLGNRYWTFRHRKGQGAGHEGVLFFLLNGVGLVICYGCIWIIQDLMGLGGSLWYTVALVVGTGLGTLFRFWSYRKWVWQIQQQPRPAGAAGRTGFAEPAMTAGRTTRGSRAGRSIPALRPPGHAAARHAASRRAPDQRPLARSRPGSHRRT
jgi:putative flippase GtrA